jgi:hypothetical protein
MELSNISKVSGVSGHTLNMEEIAGLEVAILQRRREESLLGKMLFWGKLFGSTQDYLVVANVDGTPSADFPTKKYYYWCVCQY